MTGTSVPPGFTLPWNTTKTMAEAWAGEARPEREEKRPKTNRQRKEKAQ